MESPCETPIEDLRKSALAHYERMSNELCDYNSFVVKAIRAYNPNATNWRKRGEMIQKYRGMILGAWLGCAAVVIGYDFRDWQFWFMFLPTMVLVEWINYTCQSDQEE